MPLINKNVLVTGADYFTDKFAINVWMDSSVPVDVKLAMEEHDQIVRAFKTAGINVTKVKPPAGCQDGIYTANWALVRGGKAVLSRLPNKRQAEEPYAKKVLEELGIKTITLPKEVTCFSGQGDSLACGDILFIQSGYRTSAEAQPLVSEALGFKKYIALETHPARWFKFGPAKINKVTGWPDSPTYDIDLALAVIRPATKSTKPLIAYCPAVFKKTSRKILAELNDFDKIIVSKKEALESFATNLVSTGEVVIMTSGAPKLSHDLKHYGLSVIELNLNELKKGGGSIRCTSLTLD